MVIVILVYFLMVFASVVFSLNRIIQYFLRWQSFISYLLPFFLALVFPLCFHLFFLGLLQLLNSWHFAHGALEAFSCERQKKTTVEFPRWYGMFLILLARWMHICEMIMFLLHTMNFNADIQGLLCISSKSFLTFSPKELFGGFIWIC